jgi:hypothetical protein
MLMALLLLLQSKTQPHLGCCLAAAVAAASAICMVGDILKVDNDRV